MEFPLLWHNWVAAYSDGQEGPGCVFQQDSSQGWGENIFKQQNISLLADRIISVLNTKQQRKYRDTPNKPWTRNS